MADAELIEQLRAQVKSLKSPRHATPERGTNDTASSGYDPVVQRHANDSAQGEFEGTDHRKHVWEV